MQQGNSSNGSPPPTMPIEHLTQNSSYNGVVVGRPDMSNYSLLARQYRLYFIVATVLAFILFCITVLLAILLYGKIHYLDSMEDELDLCRALRDNSNDKLELRAAKIRHGFETISFSCLLHHLPFHSYMLLFSILFSIILSFPMQFVRHGPYMIDIAEPFQPFSSKFFY
ncbi:hypothetical protein COOONC_21156, partial [Cooperia oncophora]